MLGRKRGDRRATAFRNSRLKRDDGFIFNTVIDTSWPMNINIAARLALAASLVLAAQSSPAADRTDENAGSVKEYVYKHSAGEPRKVEVHFPPDWDPSHRVPGMILFHGGGWRGGSLAKLRSVCQYFASRGLVAATADYQLADRDAGSSPSRKRVCVTDAKSAIRWMKRHADELGIDPDRVITGGGSAGGHISVLATTTAGLNDAGDDLKFDTRVVAYVLLFPAFDASDAADAEVDALAQVGKDMPPAIMFFGTRDRWKPGSDALLAHLRSLGNDSSEMWLANDQPHGFANDPPWHELALAEADRFLARLGLLEGTTSLEPPASGETLYRAP